MPRKLSDFEKKYTLKERQTTSESMLKRYPERVPVILVRGNNDVPPIEKTKYLVPQNTTVGKFIFEIRKSMRLSSDKAVFLFVNDVIPPTSALMGTIYETHKAEDNFLYIVYSGENTFG